MESISIGGCFFRDSIELWSHVAEKPRAIGIGGSGQSPCKACWEARRKTGGMSCTYIYIHVYTLPGRVMSHEEQGIAIGFSGWMNIVFLATLFFAWYIIYIHMYHVYVYIIHIYFINLCCCYIVDGRNPSKAVDLSYYCKGFMYLNWCRIFFHQG